MFGEFHCWNVDHKLAWFLTIIAAIGLTIGLACGDGGDEDETDQTPTTEATARATSTTPEATVVDQTPTTSDETPQPTGAGPTVDPADMAAIDALVDRVFAAMQQHDENPLRELANEQVRQRIQDRPEDLEAIVTCVAEGTKITIIGRDTRVLEDRARVTLIFELEEGGETREVRDAWEFERQEDGTWLLSRLPRCRFR